MAENNNQSVVLPLRSVTRHDLILAAFPAAFILFGMFSFLSSFSMYAAVMSATMVAMVAMVDGLFINPPV